MAALTKRKKLINSKLEHSKLYTIEEAVSLHQELSQHIKFKETFELAVNLGVDPRKSDQVVRSATTLPNGTGKEVRVAVFAQGDNAVAAENAGADIIGFEDLAEKIKGGNLDFDVLIATPDAMRLVGQLGQILGPRGLMPNPKVGTVTTDVKSAVTNAKAGQARYRTDKNGIIHCAIGNIVFDAKALKENVNAVLADLKKAKPASAKGVYIKKITLATTMGPGLTLDQASVVA